MAFIPYQPKAMAELELSNGKKITVFIDMLIEADMLTSKSTNGKLASKFILKKR